MWMVGILWKREMVNNNTGRIYMGLKDWFVQPNGKCGMDENSSATRFLKCLKVKTETLLV